MFYAVSQAKRDTRVTRRFKKSTEFGVERQMFLLAEEHREKAKGRAAARAISVCEEEVKARVKQSAVTTFFVAGWPAS